MAPEQPRRALDDAEHLAEHVMALDDGPDGDQLVTEEVGGCVPAVLRPGG